MALSRIKFRDFTGGLNLRDSLLDPQAYSESPACLDVRPENEGGGIEQRGGSATFSTVGSDNTKHVDNMVYWVPHDGNPPIILASINGDIYTIAQNGTTTAIYVVNPGHPLSGYTWDFEIMKDSGGTEYAWAICGQSGVGYGPIRISSAGVPGLWTGMQVNPVVFAEVLRSWRNYMVVGGGDAFGDTIYFSALGNPESWTPGTNFIQVRGSGSPSTPVVGFAVSGDDLIIFKTDSVWRLTAPPPNPVLKRVGGPGMTGRFQHCTSDNRVYFFSGKGIWSIDNRTDGLVIPLREETNHIATWFDTINDAFWPSCRMAAMPDGRVLFSFPKLMSGQLQVTSPQFLEGFPDYRRVFRKGQDSRMPWFPHSYDVTSLLPYWIDNQSVLVAGSSNSQKVIKLFSDASDTDVDINGPYGKWTSPIISLEADEPKERLRRLNILAKLTSLRVSILADTGGVGQTEVHWDLTSSSPTVFDFKRVRPETRGRYHQLVLGRSDDIDERWTVRSAELVFRGGKEH